jgi:excisionase family DNA binding protein
MDNRWHSLSAMAEYRGIAKDTIYTWISMRGMPAGRVGRLWKFKKDELGARVKSGAASDAKPTTYRGLERA